MFYGFQAEGLQPLGFAFEINGDLHFRCVLVVKGLARQYAEGLVSVA